MSRSYVFYMHFTYDIRACNDKKVFFFRAVIVVVESLFWELQEFQILGSIEDSRSKISYVGSICRIFIVNGG